MNQELLYKIALTLIPHVGAISGKNLISYCGSVEAVFASSKKALLKIPGIGVETANSIVKQEVLALAEMEMKFLKKHNVKAHYFLDDNYPSRLKHLPDAPILLYFKGNANLEAERTVGIIGTRKPTATGKIICEEFVEELKSYNVTIVSGLAFGIDVAAHKKCVDIQTPTIGVLGHGLGTIYPSAHKKVAEQMLEHGGLLTEFAHTYGPDGPHFPMRNRVVAGLCDALVVVETPKKGGSMITANFANQYHKDVFAFPGRIKDKESEGCNLLIKSHKAALLEGAKDLAYVMQWGAKSKKQDIQKSLFVELNNRQQKIVDLLKKTEQLSIDQLNATLSLTNSEMANELLDLEFKGLIKSLPGKRYLLV